MTAHSFVDESKAATYFLAAALIRPAHLSRTRSVITAMIMPGQRRIHFHNERESRRSSIMANLLQLPIEVIIFETPKQRRDRGARDKCLSALVNDHMSRDVRRLVLERDDSLVETDRRLLRSEILAAGASDTLSYEHLRAHEEPLLAMPDAIAWCWARGGHWRIKAKHLVTEVHQV